MGCHENCSSTDCIAQDVTAYTTVYATASIEPRGQGPVRMQLHPCSHRWVYQGEVSLVQPTLLYLECSCAMTPMMSMAGDMPNKGAAMMRSGSLGGTADVPSMHQCTGKQCNITSKAMFLVCTNIVYNSLLGHFILANDW